MTEHIAEIKLFIEYGCSESSELPSHLMDSDHVWDEVIDKRPPEWWERYAQTMSEDELRLLVKGMVRYEQHQSSQENRSYTLGGSVSPIIFLCREYAERFSNDEAVLMGWVVDNRVNESIPFGNIRFNDSRSFADFNARMEWLKWKNDVEH